MIKTGETMQKNVFEYLPLTFVIDNTERMQFQTQFDKFKLFFNEIERHKDKTVAEINQALQANPNLSSKAKSYQKYQLKETMFNGQNLWVFKPNDCNRGKGVTLFRSLEDLKRLLVDYTQGVEVKPLNQPKPAEDGEEAQPKPSGFIIKSDVFVIQKYIERPLLILNRKFDIRMWALVAHDHRCYLF